MKKLWRVLMPFALALSFSVPVLADMDEAIAAMQRALDNLAQYGYHLGDGGRGSAWWVWNMNPGYYNQVDRTFYRGNTYALVGVGDSRVSDLDLKVYDENWNLIDSDEDSTAVAVVSFTPRWTGVFHVRTIYYRGAPVGSLGFFIGYR